jgi:Cu/Ag efflux pump CusA
VYAEVQDALAKIEFPTEYYPVMLGEYTERQAARNRMLGWTAIALVIVFFLLQSSFTSWKLAVISYLCLPAAMVGGVLGAWLGDGIISLGSMVGFLTILGISARNGILMINHFEHLEDEEGETFGPELVLRGAKERLAPILMTATTTGLAILPLVWAGQAPGNEIEHPMSIVILGGLITATLLNLFVIPSLYLRFGDRGKPPAALAMAA